MKFLLFLIPFCAFCTSTDISMNGIKINDDKAVLKDVKLKLLADEGDVIKYRTENKNEFTVTLENDKVVFMENDWLQNPDSPEPLFSNFKFGQTTLKEIRKLFGTSGFRYDARESVSTENDAITFNCFEFDSPNNEVLVTITKVSLTAPDVTDANLADNLKLDGIIIADEKYLDEIWGKKKNYDINYKKIPNTN